MLFNAGSAYKEAGHCKTALLRYRHLLDRSLKHPDFKSRGLLEISYIYECLGEFDKSFVSLKDLDRLRSFLPWLSGQIVYPARLSIAYAQQDLPVQAERYKSLALTKVLRARQVFSTQKQLTGELSRAFYLMGRSFVSKAHVQSRGFLMSFPYHQLYILQSCFMEHKLWSDLSQKELELLFEKLALALSGQKERQKHKKIILRALTQGREMVKKEGSKKWTDFYFKKSQAIIKILGKS